MTALATETTVTPVLAFDVVVAAVRELSPNFRRITFTGEGLGLFGVDGPTLDLRIKVVVPALDANGREIPLPTFGDPRAPESGPGATALTGGWYQHWLSLDERTRGSMRTYTVRDFRHGKTPEVDVDFVMHFDDGGKGGPASMWADRAVAGDRVTIIGPNAGAVNCSTAKNYGGIEWRPGLASHVLLAGDETAVPAIAAILAALPADMTGNAILEVPDAADFHELVTAANMEINWLARGDRPHGELLDAAVRDAVLVPGAGLRQGEGDEPEDVDIDNVILWETTVESTRPFYAWIAGEAAVIRELRRYLVRDVGINRKQVAFMGYWRQGKAEA
jgi:iron complex transport system ATP-binding protein